MTHPGGRHSSTLPSPCVSLPSQGGAPGCTGGTASGGRWAGPRLVGLCRRAPGLSRQCSLCSRCFHRRRLPAFTRRWAQAEPPFRPGWGLRRVSLAACGWSQLWSPVFHLQGRSAQETLARQSQGLFPQKEGNRPEGNPHPGTCLTFSGRSPPLSEPSSLQPEVQKGGRVSQWPLPG